MTDADIAGCFGWGAFERGRAYAAEGRVVVVDRREGSAKGLVSGTTRQPYLAEVSWVLVGGDTVVEGSCSCPVELDCKHCVALLLTARSEAPSNADWRRALAGVLRTPTSTEHEGAPLALDLTSEPSPAMRRPGPRGSRLAIRPLRLGRRGDWIRTGASWRDVAAPYRYGTELDPTHVSVLKGLLSAAGSSAYRYDTRPIPLGRFGPEIWFHLGRCVEAGVELVTAAGKGPAVELSTAAAEATIDLTADRQGAVTIRNELTLEGRLLDLDTPEFGLIGEPSPHGVWIHLPGDRLQLIPLASPLHPDLARLATSPVVVPPGDVDELLDAYHPHLSRLASVGSSDGSVTIATNQLEGPVLSIERTSAGSATARWAMRYRRGDRITTYPLSRLAESEAEIRTRDFVAELAALRDLRLPLEAMPGLVDPMDRPRDITTDGPATVTLLTDVVPWLQHEGQVAVEITGDAPELREASGDPLISLAVTEAEGDESDSTDWFDLGIEVSVDGEPVEFTSLFAALTLGQSTLVLPSGTWLRLDRPELARLKELIGEARGLVDHEGPATTRLNRFHASWWDELCELGVVQSQSARWAEGVEGLRRLAAPEPVDPPAGLTAELRPYQREGLDWLAFLHANRLGGILADDMGLGKTVQTLALCLHVLEESPEARFLVVAPTSVVDNWRHEAALFAPKVEVATISQTASRRGRTLAEAIGEASIVVTSYALFRLEFEEYQRLDWEVILLDEAQFVKNRTAKTYQCVRRLDARMKVAVTGTPLENSLMDLWSLLSITAPGLYPDPVKFSEIYRKPIESGRAPERLAVLRRRIAPLMRRRTKDEVLDDLPPKTEQTVEVPLGAKHERIYQTQLQRQRQKVLGLVDDMQGNRFEIFKSLTLLRQLSLDPGLVDPEHDDVGSAKLDRLMEDLSQILAEGHRALVFSQFTRYLARLRARLDEAGVAHSYLDGRTRKRAEAVASFKEGDVPVFVISLKAGGFGLNLTEADYCFVLDPWWNPAVETQAVDRTHRIGQRNSVMVYRYVSTGTIEEKVMELKARKAALFDEIVDADGGALSGALTAEDIRGLLD